MVVDSNLGRLLNLVHKNVARSDKLFKKNCWNAHVSLCNTHFYLKLTQNVISYIYNLFEHGNLLLVADHTHLGTLEEKISAVSTTDVKVNLGADLLKKNEVTFQYQLHLYLV